MRAPAEPALAAGLLDQLSGVAAAGEERTTDGLVLVQSRDGFCCINLSGACPLESAYKNCALHARHPGRDAGHPALPRTDPGVR